MDIGRIKSIELDRSRPLKHRIVFRDEYGYAWEEIPVKEHNEYEVFMEIYKAWVNHPDFDAHDTEPSFKRKGV